MFEDRGKGKGVEDLESHTYTWIYVYIEYQVQPFGTGCPSFGGIERRNAKAKGVVLKGKSCRFWGMSSNPWKNVYPLHFRLYQNHVIRNALLLRFEERERLKLAQVPNSARVHS